MPSPYAQPRQTLPPMRMEWDHIPSPREIGVWVQLVPGVDYLWCSAANVGKARQVEGWTPIRDLQPFTIAGQCVMLLGRGEPIVGARLESASPVFRIDPDLEESLEPAPAKREKGEK